MKEIIANTFTPIYDELEDRIRLVINYQDMPNRVDFMITRSFIINLLPSADEFILKHYAKNEVDLNDIKISTPKKESNNEKNLSQTDSVNLELFRTDEQLLIEVIFSYDVNTKITSLTFSSKQIRAKAVLNADMMGQVFDTIKIAIPSFAWGISTSF